MSSMQLVFLFDLNACADFLFSPKEELNRRLLSIRLACLRLLSEFSSKYPNFKWGAKFFDSQGSKNQAMCKFVFTDFSLESFETFENEICVRYERHLSILQALLDSSQNNVSIINNQAGEETNGVLSVKTLQLALTQVLCEFQWETMDMWSPSYTKIKTRKRNFLFLFSNFKDNDESLHTFFGLNNSFSKPKFMNVFLPQSLRDSILKKADIHLVLLNMCEEQKFMGPFSSKILPLLSDILLSINGSFIPMCILSQPLYNIKLSNDLERTFCHEKEMMLSNLSIGYRNSFLLFSTVFEQSLHHPFYSNEKTSLHDCYIDFTSKKTQIPIHIMEISNKDPDLCEDISLKTGNPTKSKSECTMSSTWSKFISCCVIPRGSHFPATKVLLCLPSSCESNSTFTCCGLQKLNEYLSSGGFSLLLECTAEDGKKLPGILSSLSFDTAVISVFDPSIALKLGNEFMDCNFSKDQSLQINFVDEIKNIYSKDKDIFGNSSVIPKPFQIENLQDKPLKLNFSSKISNNSLKMKAYSNLLQQSVAGRDLKARPKRIPAQELESNAVNQFATPDEKLTDTLSNCDLLMKNLQELPSDISHEELVSAIRDAYNSAIQSSTTAVTASETIMKMLVNYSKKQDEMPYEEHISSILKDSILMNEKDRRSITEKYESLDSKEAAEKIIKECQIQILLNLEAESIKSNPDKYDCVKTVTSLLNTAGFYFSQKEMFNLDGIKERRVFLNDVLKKRYADNLHDIFEQFIHEFEDSESSLGSPAETISSEFNNEEELFSSVISSNLSEKSSSSAGSFKITNKEAKNKNTLERKLLRRRSDISDNLRHRQVLLPKSSAKKKKAKVVANKAIRYSPRLAVKRSENNKSTCEKTNKARRNLFAGDKACRTPKKSDNQLTPKSKKKNLVLKTKLAAETPAHKQNYSALQRRKSFINQSNSPKIIAESPTIRKTVKDEAHKALLEKLLKARQPLTRAVEQMPRPPSFNERTPESKRRLSLKLFSKILNSPTARLGIKKCTKRLFDQVSPQKVVENCKKVKISNESGET